MKKFFILYFILFLNVIPSLSQPTCCCDIIQTTFGFVEAGNTTVFKLPYLESFDICLSSERGDADLYVSDRNSEPSYDPDSYVLHSATCGDDFVHINKKLKRPIYVSVFGHPSAEVSMYYMNIVIRESTEVDLLNLQLLDIENEEESVNVYPEESVNVYPEESANVYPEESANVYPSELVNVYPVLVENTLEDNSIDETNRSLEEINIVPEEAPTKFFHFDTITGFFNRTTIDDSNSACVIKMLEYENQMFLDILHEDGLLISAKGLGLETVFLNVIKVYCDPGNLVLVLCTNADEETYIISELEKQNVTPLPKVLTSDYSVTEREHIYAEGGVLFVSSRIIVVDLLKHRVPIKHITGFLVYRAHKVLESCQDGFALRLYRMENKTGFVKAFSSSPESFTRGFARVERIMKTLFVKSLYLWPRFQAVVNCSLEKLKPEVIELHLELTPMMLELQTALLDLIGYIVREIKRLNPTLDTDDVTVENALSKSFQKLLQIQLDPVWHQLSSNTKQLLADLKTLRHVLLSLTQTDSIRFNNLLTSLRSTEYAHRSSGWVLMDSAETVFVTATKRMFNSKNEVDPEPSPKWRALDEILKEIRSSSVEQQQTVLILVNSIETCRQLKDYLVKGSKQLLLDLYKRFFGHKNIPGPLAAEQRAVEEEDADNDCFTLSQQHNIDTGDYKFVEYSQDNAGEEPIIIIQTFKKDNDPLSLPKTLQTHKPHFIVMYDADMTAIRQIEVFQNHNTSSRITVYFPIYAGAVEEQAYLTTLRRERSAFEFLITEKSTMVIPTDQDGKSVDCPELSRDMGKSLLESISTRRGGNEQPRKNPLVIVDMREFRSELPVLLHRRGIDIEPVTLEVGDYILSPDMCVERKSISDLIGSLNHGRLYQQATAMTRHYAKPMLLIEFDQNKPFAFQGRYYLSRDLNSRDITAKLQLLTLHFPKLKIVWSPSPYATAQLFHEIKEGRPEPSAEAAAAIGQGEGTYDDDKFNSAIVDFISKLPGVSSQNLNSILNKAESLEQLVSFSKNQLHDILKNLNHAEQLHRALHDEFRTAVEKQATTVTNKRVKSRGFQAINKKKK